MPLHDDLDEHINYELRELRATPTFYFTIYEKFDSDYSPHIIHSYSDMGQSYPQRYFEHDVFNSSNEFKVNFHFMLPF